MSQQELEGSIRSICANNSVDGVLLQLPLPSHLNEEIVMDALDPSKDVDGFHALNMGYFVLIETEITTFSISFGFVDLQVCFDIILVQQCMSFLSCC